MTRKKTIKKKLEIVFDPEKRKEFLTGFSKRKNERKKRAREELERNLKEERKRIRQEVKDGMKNLKKSFEPLRELTEEDKAEGDVVVQKEDEYEDDDVKVKIVELTTAQLAKQRNFLGENQADTSDDDEDEENDEQEDSDDNQEHNVNCIPGMDFDVTSIRKRKNKTKSDNVNDQDAEENEEDNADEPKPKQRKLRGLESLDVKSKKDLDRFTKKKMRNKLKQSKVYRLKERFQKSANQKQAKRQRNNTLKSLPKNQRNKIKTGASRYRKGRMVNKKQMRRKQKD